MSARAWLGWTDGRARQAHAKRRAAARAAAGAWLTRRAGTSEAGQTGKPTAKTRDFGSYVLLTCVQGTMY